MTAATLMALGERLDGEVAAASELVARYVADGVPWDDPVPASAHTLGFARALTAASREISDRDAARAADLAHFALAVLMTVPATDYPESAIAQAEANAWKELSTAHRMRARHNAALRALEAGERVLLPFPGLAYDRAVIALARAIVLSEANRLDEASEDLAALRPFFEELHDEYRVEQCLQLEGGIAYRRKEFERSRSLWAAALRIAERRNDVYAIASLNSNLGQVLVEMGRNEEAAVVLHTAVALYDDLALPPAAALPRWAIGRLLIANRKYVEAAESLARVRSTFLSAGNPDRAGLAGLDIADALLNAGRLSDAHRVLHEVIAEFEAAGLSERRMSAVRHLERLLEDAVIDVPRVRHIRAYLEIREPLELFVPIPE